jgi:hypothetical protein
MEALTTTSQVIDALGGTGAVAALLSSDDEKYTRKAVWNWRTFETFPSKTYVAMIEALRAQGKTAPASLWSMVKSAENAPRHDHPYQI